MAPPETGAHAGFARARSVRPLAWLLIAAALAGCSSSWHPKPDEPAYGRVSTAADAEAAARMLTGAPDNWAAVSIHRGTGSSVALPSWAGSQPPPEIVEIQKRLTRDDWHVHLQGPQANVGCTPTPCMGTGEIMVDIDAEYGIVLFGIARSEPSSDAGPPGDLTAGGPAGSCDGGHGHGC